MSIEINAVQRLRVWTETSGNFATDGTGTLTNYTDVPFIEGSLSMTLGQEMLDPEYAYQHLDQWATKLIGIKSCNLSFSMNLASTGTAAADDTAAVQGALGEILAAVMGYEELGHGTTVNDPSTTATSFTYDGTGSRTLPRSSAFGWVNSSSVLEMREITRDTGTVVYPKLALSAAPSNSDVLYAAASYQLHQNPTSSLQFIVEGAEQDDRWLLLGMQLDSMSIDFPIGQLPRITFNLKGVNWIHGASTAGTLTGSAIASASYTNHSPVHVEGNFYIQTVGTRTLPTATPVSSFSVSPNLSYVPQTSPSGTNTIARWRRTRSKPPISGSIVVPYEATTEFGFRDNKTPKLLHFQIGTAAGSSVLFTVPNAQFVDAQREGGDDIASQTLMFEGNNDTDITGAGTGTGDYSAFRIHLG